MTRAAVKCALVLVSVVSLALATSAAQKTTDVHKGQGGSPRVRTDWTLDGATVSIEYGRPFVKGRTVGKNLEPMPEQIWRLGADEPTILKTDKPLQVGALKVAPGSYSLWVMTDQSGRWKLVVSSKVPSWGTMYPGESADLARIDMKTETLPKPAEQLTIAIDSGQLRVDWESTRASVPIAVAATEKSG